MKYLRLFLVLSLVSCLLSLPPAVQADWYGPSWRYRQEIIVYPAPSSPSLSHYPIAVDLPANPNFQTDLSDIRFADSDGITPLDYWQETDFGVFPARFWIKIPALPASTPKTIYLYYGHDQTFGLSDITKPFLKATDFSRLDDFRSGLDDPGAVVLFNQKGIPQNPIVHLSDISGAAAFREQDDLVYDPYDPNLLAHPERAYKFYFSVLYPDFNAIYVAFSVDGTQWGHHTRLNITRNSQDPSVVQKLYPKGEVYRDPEGYLYLYLEDNTTNTIYLYRSQDGINFTPYTSPVIARGAINTWDYTLVGSPVARHTGTHFIVGYEGISSAGIEAFGSAHGTQPGLLTKNANNPLLSPADHPHAVQSIVVDGFWLNQTQNALYFLIHDGKASGGIIFRAKTTNLQPATWTKGQIVPFGSAPLDAKIRNDVTLDNSQGLKRLVTTTLNDSAVVLYDLSGPAAPWAVHREGIGDEMNAEESPVYLNPDHQLVIQPKSPAANSDFFLSLYTSTPLPPTSGFEILTRVKQESQILNQWAFLGFGSGSMANAVEAGIQAHHYGGLSSGYLSWFLRPGMTNGWRLKEFDSLHSSLEIGANSLLPADLSSFQNRSFAYLGSGQLTSRVGNASISTVDTTYLATPKKIYFGQGQRAADDVAAKSTYAWLAVRPYIGSDPIASVSGQVTDYLDSDIDQNTDWLDYSHLIKFYNDPYNLFNVNRLINFL